MKLTFLGANHEVTGSCTLLEAAGQRYLIDCGMEQGKDVYENQPFPVAPGEIDGVLVTHAHIDHMAEATRLHNDANVLALGGRVIGPGLAVKITETFLTTEFSNEERHIRRINMLEN